MCILKHLFHTINLVMFNSYLREIVIFQKHMITLGQKWKMSSCYELQDWFKWISTLIKWCTSTNTSPSGKYECVTPESNVWLICIRAKNNFFSDASINWLVLPIVDFIRWSLLPLLLFHEVCHSFKVFIDKRFSIGNKIKMCLVEYKWSLCLMIPHERSQNIGFLCSTGPDPLKNHKASKPVFTVGTSSARQRNAI